VPKYIIDELRASGTVPEILNEWWDDEKNSFSITDEMVGMYVKEYFLKNLFTTIYKYVTGIYK